MYISPQKINEFLILLENHSDSLISTQEAYDQGLKLVQVVERLSAYFGAKRPPVSDQSGHPFRSKTATCFGPIRPPLPGSLLRSF
jgi:hypothetical protein